MSPQNYDNPDPNQDGNVDPQHRGQAGGSSRQSASGSASTKDVNSLFHANFAHEMANLLDGSLRNVSLVMASLREVQQQRAQAISQTDGDLTGANPTGDASAALSAPSADAKPALSPPSPDLVLRLETADIAMRQMAQMIQQLLAGHENESTGKQAGKVTDLAIAKTKSKTPDPIYSTVDTFTLTQAAEHVMRLLKPIADEQQIGLELVIDTQAAKLPIGPLFPVIVNAVRNSLQAIAAYKEACDSSQASADHAFAVQVNANICEESKKQYLQLTITDNGPGLDPVTLDEHGRFVFGASTRAQGHGLGLPLARDIVKTLGGDIDITGPGRGPGSAQYDPADKNISTFTQHHGAQGTQLVVMVPLHRLASLAANPTANPAIAPNQ